MSKARDIASAAPAPSTVSATEIGYLDGVSSAIQTQLDGKASTTADIPKSLIDAKGDLIVGSAADTAARLAVGGTNGHVLQVNSSATNGIEWAAASSGSLTLLSTTSLSGATVTVSAIDQTYTHLYLIAYGLTNATSVGSFRFYPNNVSNNNNFNGLQAGNTTVRSGTATALEWSGDLDAMTRTDANNSMSMLIQNYADTNMYKHFTAQYLHNSSGVKAGTVIGTFSATTAITSVVVFNSGGNLSTGTLKIYGVK